MDTSKEGRVEKTDSGHAMDKGSSNILDELFDFDADVDSGNVTDGENGGNMIDSGNVTDMDSSDTLAEPF